MLYIYKLLIITLLLLLNKTGDNEIIVDSNISLEKAFLGKTIPEKIKSQLVLIEVIYHSFDGKRHKGQLLLNKSVSEEMQNIFKVIDREKFPLAKVIPISHYNWNDSLSMADNNTSAFNYRAVKGTRKLSAHSYGRAIDINPLLNPQYKRGKISPHNGKYDKDADGTLYHESPIVKEFKKYGWKWGGNWRSTKDYMHFEK